MTEELELRVVGDAADEEVGVITIVVPLMTVTVVTAKVEDVDCDERLKLFKPGDTTT
jgi:hypothetical protein